LILQKVERLPHAKVWGGSSRVKALTEQALVDNQTIADIIPGISLKCIHTPCHTQDSFCFYLTSPSCPEGALFTGDTLFIGGCGRFFEGTPGEMNVAFDKILGDDKNVPGNTKVFVGHEYTAGNIAFAESILGKEDAELGRLNELLKNNSGSVIGKTTIADERRWNIFWKDVWQRADKYKSGKHDDVLGEIRSLKDNFRA
jgi:hydroxyacylglutathione hydrolase